MNLGGQQLSDPLVPNPSLLHLHGPGLARMSCLVLCWLLRHKHNPLSPGEHEEPAAGLVTTLLPSSSTSLQGQAAG